MIRDEKQDEAKWGSGFNERRGNESETWMGICDEGHVM